MVSVEELEALIKTQSLVLNVEKQAYYLQKENMFPWKVFTVHQTLTHDDIWITFRFHRLCGAKYNYFSQNKDKIVPVRSDYSNFHECGLMEYIKCLYGESDGLLILNSNLYLSYSFLQTITNKDVFLKMMESFDIDA